MVNLAQQFKCFATVKSLFSVPPRYSENGRRSISLRSRWHAPQSGPSTILLCYFRRLRYLERFFFLLSAGFRSFECVLVTVGINRVVVDGQTAHSLSHARARATPPLDVIRPSVDPAMSRQRWRCCPIREKNDAFGSELTAN